MAMVLKHCFSQLSLSNWSKEKMVGIPVSYPMSHLVFQFFEYMQQLQVF